MRCGMSVWNLYIVLVWLQFRFISPFYLITLICDSLLVPLQYNFTCICVAHWYAFCVRIKQLRKLGKETGCTQYLYELIVSLFIVVSMCSQSTIYTALVHHSWTLLCSPPHQSQLLM